MGLEVSAHAKINLGLEILRKLENGMHELNMITQSVSLCDYVNVSINSENVGIRLTCDKNICQLEENIAYKAAEYFFRDFGIFCNGIEIHINKNIPVKSGLGGGSADAAAVIFALSKIYGVIESNYNDFLSFFLQNPKNSEKILKISSKIGSDVPICLIGGTLIFSNNIFKSIAPIQDCKIILIKPGFGISTKQAYNEFDSNSFLEKPKDRIENLELAIISKNIDNIFKKVFNDFECIQNHHDRFKLTGSGSARFRIFSDKKNAEFVFSKICKKKQNNSYVFLCEPVNFGVKIIDNFRN
ncbi:MAG: 4-(cytidine 5'-diphospho)-2-C-methyl-D-erythritol kinase [Oscillospiraceae bacterium]|jgi:4-diphosphocytidyl-2-C-methyl-D-erythritol kinase|nr:4-(cytidine 5'-diphospho)-2-C-methyl-D-erythritol kinase [Oscillospiraceae bacterium]